MLIRNFAVRLTPFTFQSSETGASCVEQVTAENTEWHMVLKMGPSKTVVKTAKLSDSDSDWDSDSDDPKAGETDTARRTLAKEGFLHKKVGVKSGNWSRQWFVLDGMFVQTCSCCTLTLSY